MKKYLVLSFLFMLVVTPVVAKNSDNGQMAQPTNNSNKMVTVTPVKLETVTTGEQIETQNQGEDSRLSIQTQESEQLNQKVDDSFTQVSDQVKQLIETVGAKDGIGQEVKDIAQSQTKLQDEIKSDYFQLNSRGTVTKFFVGSDKKLIQSMEQKMEQNRLMIQQLEELKLKTTNSGELQQLQETIDLMTYQNTSLQDKINQENKSKGIFGWLVNLFR